MEERMKEGRKERKAKNNLVPESPQLSHYPTLVWNK